MNRIFALAAVTAISGGMLAASAAGCSGDDKADDSADGGADAAPDARRPPVDSGPEDSGPGTCPTETPITSSDIEQQLGAWKGPEGIKADCVQGDIDAIKALFESAGSGGVKYDDIKAAVSAACGGCLFTPKDGARWGMFIDTGTGYVDNSVGACLAIEKDDACGKARFNWEICINAACTEEGCGTQSAIDRCVPETFDAACKETTDTYTAACPNEQELLDGCGNLYETIALTCGGGPDAGLDASSK